MVWGVGCWLYAQWDDESVSHFDKFFFLALKAQNAESRFLIERIGLKAAYSIKPPHIKSSPLGKRRKQHSKEKAHFQTLSGHVGVKRQFNTQNSLIPRPFDVSSVKGKMPI